MDTNRTEQIATVKAAIQAIPFCPYFVEAAFSPGWGTLAEFVTDTWVGDLADAIFQKAAEAAVSAIEKDLK